MRKFFRALSVCTLIFCGFVLCSGVFVFKNTPDTYKITCNSGMELPDKPLGVTAKTAGDRKIIEAGALSLNDKSYNANIMLMNSIPVKDVNIRVVEETRVIPCGNPFGVKIFTQGVVIVGIADVRTEHGILNPAKSAGLKKGDIILSIDGVQINSNEELSAIVEASGGKTLKLFVRRDAETMDIELTPVISASDGIYKAGLWVRDSCAGIGTITFYNPESKVFAGLGHGICDVDTGELMPLSHGDIVKANINGIVRGAKGSPGELQGCFSDCTAIGSLYSNVNAGVYGKLECSPSENSAMLVAMKQQVKRGRASILTTISGDTPQCYDIEILSVNYDDRCPTKNMVIEITDGRLLEETGGIVQGMSGSPIMQNNRLVGAITHVFVNEPTKGYAIFAENMVSCAENVSILDIKKAS